MALPTRLSQVQVSDPVKISGFPDHNERDTDLGACFGEFLRRIVPTSQAYVTAGEIASQTATRLQQADQYDRGFKVHGLAATVAEAMAEFIQQRIRVAMGVPKGQGLRYSWGYLACPNVSDQVKVLDLLPRATTELGISLTSGYQFDPDQTTAALVVHHPDAIYFAVLGGDTNTDELAV